MTRFEQLQADVRDLSAELQPLSGVDPKSRTALDVTARELFECCGLLGQDAEKLASAKRALRRAWDSFRHFQPEANVAGCDLDNVFYLVTRLVVKQDALGHIATLVPLIEQAQQAQRLAGRVMYRACKLSQPQDVAAHLAEHARDICERAVSSYTSAHTHACAVAHECRERDQNIHGFRSEGDVLLEAGRRLLEAAKKIFLESGGSLADK